MRESYGEGVGHIRLIAAIVIVVGVSSTVVAIPSRAVLARSSYLEAPVLPGYSIQPSGFTVEFWIRVRSVAGFDPPLLICTDYSGGQCGDPETACWSLSICNLSACAPGSVHFSFKGDGKCFDFYSATRVDDGRYHHIAVTYDGSVGRVYVDGTSGAPQAMGTRRAVMRQGVLMVGTSPDRMNAFDGEMDELRIWSVARSRDEIRSTMTVPVSPATRGLEGYWPFDGTGEDQSVHRNPLVPHNYVVFPNGRVKRAADIINEDLFRG